MIKLDKKLKIGFTVFTILGVVALSDAKPINVNAELGKGLTAGVATDLYNLDGSNRSLVAGVSSVVYNSRNLSGVSVIRHKEEVVTDANPFTEINSEMWTTDYVNMRDADTKSANIIKQVRIGAKVIALGYENEYWYKVEYDGQVGYICSDYLSETSPYMKVSSTAYYNPNGNKTADCSDTVAGLTLAGKQEWLGKGCYIYNVAEDGSVGSCRGYYEFHDTGWGRDGDIPRGETVDIYMTTEDECRTYGRQDIYILFVD